MIGWLGEQTGDMQVYVERSELESVRNNHGAIQGEVLRLGIPGGNPSERLGRKRKATLYFDNGTLGEDGRTMKSFVGDHKPERVTIHLSARDYRKLFEEKFIDFYDMDTKHSVRVTIKDTIDDLGFYEALAKSLQTATI